METPLQRFILQFQEMVISWVISVDMINNNDNNNLYTAKLQIASKQLKGKRSQLVRKETKDFARQITSNQLASIHYNNDKYYKRII